MHSQVSNTKPFIDHDAGYSAKSSKGPLAEEDHEIAAKVTLLNHKISSNISAMPSALKRMNDCWKGSANVSRLLGVCNVAVSPIKGSRFGKYPIDKPPQWGLAGPPAGKYRTHVQVMVAWASGPYRPRATSKHLAVIGSAREVVRDSDVQNILLNGLDSAYDAIVTTLTARLDDIEMDEFQSHLFAFEMRLEAQNAALLPTPTANIATQHRNGGRYNQAGRNNHSQVRYNHPQNCLNNFQSRSNNRESKNSVAEISKPILPILESKRSSYKISNSRVKILLKNSYDAKKKAP
ncbi:hypothetical protein IFM89_027262 [Coptis chinensis]|uniref:Uncharacterized protein n=1 Tax=Coptis chinensis TaxID=261450 RepID=A0A835IY23_9MAGN|nr:hypothetical protein IFM89_027262 [Coptis chinensis]